MFVRLLSFVTLTSLFIGSIAQPLSPETCRFNEFDFSSLSRAGPEQTGFDFRTVANGLFYYINPCSTNTQPACAIREVFAGVTPPAPSLCGCNIAVDDGTGICSPIATTVLIYQRAPFDFVATDIDTPVWSYIRGNRANGVQYSLSNGEPCTSNINVRFSTIVQFVCGTGDATYESITISGCSSTSVIRTSLACIASPSSSSSTGPSSSSSIGVSSSPVSSSTGPLIIGDPQFVGLRGQSFQVHGIDGEYYNLVSSSATHINAKFVFLNDGSCPIINGIVQTNCWSHPGSYLGVIGVQQVVGDHVNKLLVVSGEAQQGFASVMLNGRLLSVGDNIIDSEAFSVSFESTHRVRCRTTEFEFVFESSDKFINQGITMRLPINEITAHGLIGQTHQSKLYATPIKYIAGDIDDYLIDERDIWGTSFLFNRFHQ